MFDPYLSEKSANQPNKLSEKESTSSLFWFWFLRSSHRLASNGISESMGGFGTPRNVLEQIGTSWNILEQIGTNWNFLAHSGTFWNILEHVGTLVWNLLRGFHGDLRDEKGV